MSPRDARPPETRARAWKAAASLAGPVLLLTAVAILVFSNTGSTSVRWANWDLNAPLYLVLLVTLFAGAAGWPMLRWAWRRRRAKDARRREEEEEERKWEAEVSRRLREEEEKRRRDRGLDE